MILGSSLKLNNFLRWCFFFFIVKPFMHIVFGFRVVNPSNLPLGKQCIIIANHSSHIDTMCLLTIFPMADLLKIHPIAAADYFYTNKINSWFMKNLIGAVPFNRNRRSYTHKAHEQNIAEGSSANELHNKLMSTVFADVEKVIENGESVIIFPEGTRTTDYNMHEFKQGIGILATRFPNIPIIPVYINGADKILPKNEFIPVPHIIEMIIGESQYYKESRLSAKEIANDLYERVSELKIELEESNKQ